MEVWFIFVALALLIGVPLALTYLAPDSKWGSIGCATIVTPFFLLGATKLLGKIYWALYPGSGSGCSGGECGANSYAGGLWPLLIPIFMVPAFFFSLIVVLTVRATRK